MASKRILGGNAATSGLLSEDNAGTGQGSYARFPAGTPQFHTGNDVASVRAQARFYLRVGNAAAYQKLRAAVPARARAIFDVLCTEAAGPGVGVFDFLVDNVATSSAEKVQVVETLGDAYVAYFFGERAPVWSITGHLLNTQQERWYDAWHVLYQDILRGTQLSRYGVPARFVYNGREAQGYLTQSNETLGASLETAASLSVQFLVKRVTLRGGVGVTNPAKGYSEAPKLATPAAPAVPGKVVTDFAAGVGAAVAAGQATLSGGLPLSDGASAVRPGADTSEMAARGMGAYLPAG